MPSRPTSVAVTKPGPKAGLKRQIIQPRSCVIVGFP
jgi:hypothetical protein